MLYNLVIDQVAHKYVRAYSIKKWSKPERLI